jgi:hypothetical protein
MLRRSSLAAAAVALALLLPTTAWANEQTDLEKGRAAYLAHEYGEADARFRAMLDPKSGTLKDQAMITQARMYWGAVKLAENRPEEATAIFEQLLLDDPGFDPDPLSFPTSVIDLFIDTRAKIRDKINAAAQAAAQAEVARKAREEEERRRERARVATLERMAEEEEVRERHSRLVALVPFGAGQFQNGQTAAGWFFLVSESALALASAVTVPIYLVDLQSRSDAARAGDTVRAQEYIDRAVTVRTVNLALLGALAVTAGIGVIQANVAYVPEVHDVKKRAVPQAVLEPIVAPAPNGCTIGAALRF